MKTIVKLPTDSKNVKKFLTKQGVKVLRCSKNTSNGLLLTVEGSISNIEKAIKLLTSIDFTRFDGTSLKCLNKSNQSFYDFGNIYRTEINF